LDSLLGEKDGYMTGKVEWIDDDAFDPDSEENTKLLKNALVVTQAFLEAIPVRPRYQVTVPFDWRS